MSIQKEEDEAGEALGPGGNGALTALSALTRLRALRLQLDPGPLPPESLASLAGLTSLRLFGSGQELSAAHLGGCTALRGFTALEVQIALSGEEALAAWAGLEELCWQSCAEEAAAAGDNAPPAFLRVLGQLLKLRQVGD